MSILCCCGSRRTTREVSLDTIELPALPPRAKLSKSPFPISELELLPSFVTTQAPLLLHNPIPEATVDPAILEVEDSDDEEPVRSTRNSSTGTLEVIRTKFIRPRSQKSELKRSSQQSLGTSDEEVARRAELKRLMRKRIQEELKSEEEQEEADEKTGNLDEPKPDISPSVEVLGGGPRDYIEFSVSDANDAASRGPTSESLDFVLLTLPISDSQPSISLRRSSFPGSSSRSHETSVSEGHGTLKERGSMPHFPPSPQLAPVHLSSLRGSESLCSWRLSYSAEQLASCLGIPDDLKSTTSLEPGETTIRGGDVDKENDHQPYIESRTPSGRGSASILELTENTQQPQFTPNHGEQHDPADTPSYEDPHSDASHNMGSGQDSLMDIWLCSQEWQSNSAVSSRRTSDMILQAIPEGSNHDGQLAMSRGIVEPQVLANDLPIISGPLSGIGDGPSQVQLSPHNSHIPAGIGPIELPVHNPDKLQKPTSHGTGDSPGDIVSGSADHDRDVSSSHYASSRYTTRPNSGQATVKGSRLSLMELLGGRKAILPFPSFSRLISPSYTTDADKSEASSYKTAQNEASTVDVTMYEVHHLRAVTVETGSVAISDTASFKQREAELKSIEKRFGRVHLRRDTATPIVSKFREEFNEPRASIISRRSLFAKLHLSIPTRAKHLAQYTQLYNIYGSNEESLGSAIGLPNKQVSKDEVDGHTDGGDGAGGLRYPIVRRASDVSSAQKHPPESLKSQVCRSTPQLSHEPIVSTFKLETADLEQAGSSPNPRVEPGSTLKPPCRAGDNNSPKSDISNSVLREWVNLMNVPDFQAQAEVKVEPQNRGPPRFRTPPASWAKWPSHTRHERTGPAGREDNVIARDFAVLAGADGNGIAWSTDKPSESSKRYIVPATRSLSTQLGKAVKGSLSKVVQGTLSRDTRASSETHRDRQKLDGHLEYPELEILPMHGGYEELQALEQQIDNLKRGSVSAESQLARLSPENARTPLSMHLAERVHMMQHESPRDLCKDDEDTVLTLPTVSPMTPGQMLLTPQGVSEATDHFDTSGSNVSYEDCVPKHMLEDEGPVDSDTMSMKDGRNTQNA
ncbi:hypothetical protein F4677DRAFT_463419 [Hypoxylon crocopeplum]|nr:hypothetical protein F4677DRAFT_463419 [Hypoxylon crocopeplum]